MEQCYYLLKLNLSILMYQAAAAKQILEQESQANEMMTEELGHYPGPEAMKPPQPGGVGGRAPPGRS